MVYCCPCRDPQGMIIVSFVSSSCTVENKDTRTKVLAGVGYSNFTLVHGLSPPLSTVAPACPRLFGVRCCERKPPTYCCMQYFALRGVYWFVRFFLLMNLLLSQSRPSAVMFAPVVALLPVTYPATSALFPVGHALAVRRGSSFKGNRAAA